MIQVLLPWIIWKEYRHAVILNGLEIIGTNIFNKRKVKEDGHHCLKLRKVSKKNRGYIFRKHINSMIKSTPWLCSKQWKILGNKYLLEQNLNHLSCLSRIIIFVIQIAKLQKALCTSMPWKLLFIKHLMMPHEIMKNQKLLL